MPWAGKIMRSGIGVNGDSNRMSAIIGRNTGGHPFGGVDRFTEGSTEACSIHGRHGLQIETRTRFGVERQTNQAATARSHEVDRFRRNFLGRDGEIAFVLAVLIVYDNKNLALPKICYCVRDR